jgi:FkbM family methyltransferase
LWVFWLVNHVVCRAILPELRDPIRCPTMYGFDLSVRRHTGENYYRCGFYEQGTMHVIHHCLRPGDTFVDAGASVGQMSFLAARRVGLSGHVLSFEPAPERIDDLELGVELNALSNVRVFPVGLAAETAEVSLYMRGSPSMVDQANAEDTVTVGVRRLDDVVAELGLPEVRMIKIDVEGFESNVLAGAQHLLASAHPPIVCYEHGIYPSNRTPSDVLAEYGGGRYAFFQLSRTMHRPSVLRQVDPRRLRADNVFAIPSSALDSLPRTLLAGV